MKKSAFTEQHRISLSKPSSLAIHRTTVCDFAFTLQNFLTENFDGAVKITSRITLRDLGYVNLCTQYVAYVLKLLLAHFRGERILCIKMSIDEENKLVMRLEGEDFWNMSSKERHDMVRAAHSTRFSVFSSRHGIVMKKRIKSQVIFSLYAVSKNRFREELDSVFFNGYFEENHPEFMAEIAKAHAAEAQWQKGSARKKTNL